MDNQEYGTKFADVCVSLNRARNQSGGISLTVEEMINAPVQDLFDTMARNGIRFIHQPGEIEDDETV